MTVCIMMKTTDFHFIIRESREFSRLAGLFPFPCNGVCGTGVCIVDLLVLQISSNESELFPRAPFYYTTPSEKISARNLISTLRCSANLLSVSIKLTIQ